MTNPPDPATLMEPIRSYERVESIDVLRGLALFGIIAANIRGFAGPAVVYIDPGLFWPGLPDRLAQAFIDTFIQGKFITIFSFLFGAGFAVQLSRAEAKGGAFGTIYFRRLIGLLVIGLIHGLLIWWGDILLPYALTGLLLLLFRSSNNFSITFWAIALYLIPALLILFVAVLPVLTGMPMPADPPLSAEELQSVISTYGEGNWNEIQRQRVEDALEHNWAYSPLMIPQLLGLFLFGVLAWRKRLFTPSPASLPRYRMAMIAGFTIGITGNALATISAWYSPAPLFPPRVDVLPIFLLRELTNPALSLGYILLVILLCQDDLWRKRLRRAGAVGRTALTNYLLQSVLATLIFYGYGFGLYGMGPAALLIPTFLIFAFELWISPLWIERWRFGPVEWLWRSITYERIQPMARNHDST